MSDIQESEIGKVIPGQVDGSGMMRSYYFCRQGSCVFSEKGIMMSFRRFKTMYPLRGYSDVMRGLMRFQEERKYKSQLPRGN